MISEEKKNKLFELSKEIVNSMKDKGIFVSVGYFFTDQLLIVGINPGYPKTEKALRLALMMNDIEDPREREVFYYNILYNNYIGKYIKQITGDMSKTSYTNLLKVPIEKDDLSKIGELIEKYRHFTDKQIEILKPKRILCFGRFVANYFGLKGIDYNVPTMINDVEYMMVKHPINMRFKMYGKYAKL